MKYLIFATTLLSTFQLNIKGPVPYVNTSLPFFKAANNLIVDFEYIFLLFSAPMISTLSGKSTLIGTFSTHNKSVLLIICLSSFILYILL